MKNGVSDIVFDAGRPCRRKAETDLQRRRKLIRPDRSVRQRAIRARNSSDEIRNILDAVLKPREIAIELRARKIVVALRLLKAGVAVADVVKVWIRQLRTPQLYLSS